MRKMIAMLILGLSAAMLIPAAHSLAQTFDLSYSLTEGGLRLELAPVDPYKGVKLDITSDVATRYEIIQKIVKPVENRDKPGVVAGDSFVLRAIRGTNRFGTLYGPATDTPVRSEEILYTSDTAGTQDTFTLVYGVVNPENIEPGYYYGKIGFILRPISSTREQVTRFLDIYLNITREAEAKPRIEIVISDGSKTIKLNPKNEEMLTADVVVKINGVFRKMFNLTQFLARPIESTEGDQFSSEALNFTVKEAKKGAGAALTPLSNQPQKVYNSGPNGEADEYFVITYSLGDLSGQKAGRYTGFIQYFLDEMGEQAKLETLALEIENERVFDLLITPQDQMSRIEFRDLKPKEEAKKNEVIFEIKTNIGRQYQVGQNVLSDLTDKTGKTIAPENFSLRTEAFKDTKGTVKIAQKNEVKKGETALFISDNQGSSDKFKVVYELKTPPDTIAGDYSTRITYSLLEI